MSYTQISPEIPSSEGDIEGQVVWDLALTEIAEVNPWDGLIATILNLTLTASQLNAIRDLRIRVVHDTPLTDETTLTLSTTMAGLAIAIDTFVIDDDFDNEWLSLSDMFNLEQIVSGIISITILKTTGAGGVGNSYQANYLKGLIT